MIEITSAMVDALRKSKPWVRVVAIALLGGAVLLPMTTSFFVLRGKVPRPAIFVGMNVFIAVVLAIAAFHLFRFAAAIGDGMNADAIEHALRRQRSALQFIGIAVAIFIPLFVAVFILTRI